MKKKIILTRIPHPLSWIVMHFMPPFLRVTTMLVAPASKLSMKNMIYILSNEPSPQQTYSLSFLWPHWMVDGWLHRHWFSWLHHHPIWRLSLLVLHLAPFYHLKLPITCIIGRRKQSFIVNVILISNEINLLAKLMTVKVSSSGTCYGGNQLANDYLLITTWQTNDW